MANITITNNDNGSVVIDGRGFADGTLVNADAVDPATFVAGTILARLAAGGSFQPFDPAGAGGLEIPKAVLTYDVTLAALGSIGARVLVAGDVDQNRLVIHDGTTITAAHLDALRDYGIVPLDVKQLAVYDNPDNP